MKRAESNESAEEKSSGFNPIPVVIGVAIAAVGGFLFFGPTAERGSDLDVLAAGEPEAVAQAVRRLCANDSGVAEMGAKLEGMTRGSRASLLDLASKEKDCMGKLPEALRAEHALWDPDGSPPVVVSVGKAAIEPALVAIDDGGDAVIIRALSALVSLKDSMSEDQRQRSSKRARRLAETSEDAPERLDAANALLVALGEEPFEKEEEEDDDSDFQLGGGGLRLQLGGAAPPAARPPAGASGGGGLELRQPSLKLEGRAKGGVLFDASKSGR